MEPFTFMEIASRLAGGLAQGISRYQAGQSAAKADRYRASLADENAQRAELVGLEKEFRARQEGVLDAGRYQMQATQSGLSGVSKDIWVGQRYMEIYRDVSNARLTKEQTVSRFLKEADWHRQNARAASSSASWSALGTGLSTFADVIDTYNKIPKKGGSNGFFKYKASFS